MYENVTDPLAASDVVVGPRPGLRRIVHDDELGPASEGQVQSPAHAVPVKEIPGVQRLRFRCRPCGKWSSSKAY